MNLEKLFIRKISSSFVLKLNRLNRLNFVFSGKRTTKHTANMVSGKLFYTELITASVLWKYNYTRWNSQCNRLWPIRCVDFIFIWKLYYSFISTKLNAIIILPLQVNYNVKSFFFRFALSLLNISYFDNEIDCAYTAHSCETMKYNIFNLCFYLFSTYT